MENYGIIIFMMMDAFISHGYKWYNLTEEEYSQGLKSSETIESIIKEKDFNE